MTFRTPGGRSIHWATRTHGEPGHLTEFLYDMRLLPPAGFSNEYVINSDSSSYITFIYIFTALQFHHHSFKPYHLHKFWLNLAAFLKSRLLLFSFHYFVIGPDSNGKVNSKKNATFLSFTEIRFSRHTLRKIHTDDDNFAIAVVS